MRSFVLHTVLIIYCMPRSVSFDYPEHSRADHFSRVTVAQTTGLKISITPSDSTTTTPGVVTSLSRSETLTKISSSHLAPLPSTSGKGTRPYLNTIVYHQPPPPNRQTASTTTPTLTPSQPDAIGGRHHRGHNRARALVFFEVLGGLVTLIFILGFIRCLYSYKKTPARDRIAALLNRHSLHTEMEELGRRARRRDSMQRPPPPPYAPPPPTYDVVVGCNLPNLPIPPVLQTPNVQETRSYRTTHRCSLIPDPQGVLHQGASQMAVPGTKPALGPYEGPRQ